MKIITEPTSLKKLWDNRETDFTEMIKIVVDISRGILAIDGEMHADLEHLLLADGSSQENLWGANIYPAKKEDDFLEFTSFINIRPSQGNRSMEVIDPGIRAEIKEIVRQIFPKQCIH
jgi:hypothetical protein